VYGEGRGWEREFKSVGGSGNFPKTNPSLVKVIDEGCGMNEVRENCMTKGKRIMPTQSIHT